MALTKVIQQLRSELNSKNSEIKTINKAITLLQNGRGTQQFRIGRKMSPEAIAKISAGRKRYFANKKKAPTSDKGS